MDADNCNNTQLFCGSSPTPPPPTPDPAVWTYQGGGAGTTGYLGPDGLGTDYDTCTVTSLSDDGSAGTLRDCVAGAGEGGSTHTKPRRTIFDLTGVAKPWVIWVPCGHDPISIRSPYQTIDGYTAGDLVTVREGPSDDPDGAFCESKPTFQIIATHDIQVRDIEFIGGQPWPLGHHNNSMIIADSGAHTSHAWDPHNTWENNQRIMIEHCTFKNGYDDMGTFYAGFKNATFQFNLSYNNYHPNSRGANGWKGLYCNQGPPPSGVCPDQKPPNGCGNWTNPPGCTPGQPGCINLGNCFEHREYVSDIQNVWWNNGERQPGNKRGAYWFDSVQNIIGNWRDYSTGQGNGPGGYGMENSEGPNWWYNGIGNLFIPPVGTQTHYAWDCLQGSTANAPVNDTTFAKQFWSLNWFVQGHDTDHCVSRPIANPPTQEYHRDYALPDLTKNPRVPADQTYFDTIIDRAGTRFPTGQDTNIKAEVKQYYHARFSEPGAVWELAADRTYCAGSDSENLYNLYRAIPGTAPRPLVIVPNAAGWGRSHRLIPAGTPDDYFLTAATSAGMNVASIEVRVAPAGSSNRWPVMATDVDCFVRFAHQNATQLGIDANKIYIFGGSGGGHLALMAALAPGAYPTDQLPLVDDTVRAAASWYAPTDLAVGWDTPAVDGYIWDCVASTSITRVFSGSCTHPDASDAATHLTLDGASPTCRVTGTCSGITATASPLPPTAMWHGAIDGANCNGNPECDGGIPPAQATELYNALVARSTPTQVTIVPGADHGWLGLTAAQIEQIADDTVAWLVAH